MNCKSSESPEPTSYKKKSWQSQPDTKPNSEGIRFTMEDYKARINTQVPVFLLRNP